ncbi:polysaccharide deacetylase family protein [Rathayibacter oskolensis]|uniref:polysaccharide deacetylase family protein n=1 Tax=Rathayibacter oskolensis TaxID=1891671 RepID=UPI00265F6176|nr:polysaccharide deacetylase family protein [Rathayibacter oskolensis]WKK73409.1 polysaccharide deacetylase family protein [Rathayibacter oskolensis]
MTADGWEFASHSWGHIDMRESSMERITADVGKWRDEVQPIVGATDLFVYPFGADIAGVGAYSGPTYDLLAAEGFTAFFNVDASRPAWGQWGAGYLREARINVDGISLRAAIEGRNDTLRAFFDPESVLDPARPASISGSDAGLSASPAEGGGSRYARCAGYSISRGRTTSAERRVRPSTAEGPRSQLMSC